MVDPDDYNTALDPDVKQDYLNCLFHRMPTLPRDGEIVGFSSMYTVNQVRDACVRACARACV